MKSSRPKVPVRPAPRSRRPRRANPDPVADTLERTADVIDSIAATLAKVAKNLDKHCKASGERHAVVNDRLQTIEKSLKQIHSSLGGLTVVVKTNNELARQLHEAGVNEFGMVKARIRKVETELEQRGERDAARGRVETT